MPPKHVVLPRKINKDRYKRKTANKQKGGSTKPSVPECKCGCNCLFTKVNNEYGSTANTDLRVSRCRKELEGITKADKHAAIYNKISEAHSGQSENGRYSYKHSLGRPDKPGYIEDACDSSFCIAYGISERTYKRIRDDYKKEKINKETCSLSSNYGKGTRC